LVRSFNNLQKTDHPNSTVDDQLNHKS
jgi:hypothetical protein